MNLLDTPAVSLQSLGYAPYLRSVGNIEYELETIPQGTIIKRARGEERHVLSPFSEQGGHAEARARFVEENWETVFGLFVVCLSLWTIKPLGRAYSQLMLKA